MNASKDHVTANAKPADEWRIGFVLIRAGRLRKEDVVRIVARQRQTNMRFGDAAISLGILKESDIRFALARQFDHSYVTNGESKILRDVVMAYEPECPVAESIRALRSQLMLRWFDRGKPAQYAMAVNSSDTGVGRSWLAANLAVAFSQLGKKTILVDADLRSPRQHELFGLENREGSAELLCGRSELEEVIQRNQVLPNLSVIASGTIPPNPQEIIARGGFQRLMDRLRGTAEVIIIDTPADARASDGKILAMHAGAALLMAKRALSNASSLKNYYAAIRETGAVVLHSILVA